MGWIGGGTDSAGDRVRKPDSWFDNGGSIGAIHLVRRRLIVTQSGEGIRRVEAFLTDLRNELLAPPPATRPAVPVIVPIEVRPGTTAVLLTQAIRIEKLDLPKVTLEQAIEQLGKAADVPMEVNWRAIENAGVSRRTPVSVHLRDVPLGQALVDVLSGAGGGVVWFRAWEHDGNVRVSTWEDRKPGPARFYDIRDLLQALRATQADRFSGAGGREGGTRHPEDEIIRSVTENVEPDSWRDAGGSDGSIRSLWGRLIVVQTPEGHRALERYLATLRREFVKDDTARPPATSPSAPTRPSPPVGGSPRSGPGSPSGARPPAR